MPDTDTMRTEMGTIINMIVQANLAQRGDSQENLEEILTALSDVTKQTIGDWAENLYEAGQSTALNKGSHSDAGFSSNKSEAA